MYHKYGADFGFRISDLGFRISDCADEPRSTHPFKEVNVMQIKTYFYLMLGSMLIGCFLLMRIFFAHSSDIESVNPPSHAFYLSVLEIDYPVEDGHTALKLKVFSDDLQNAISEYHRLEHLVTIESLCGSSTEMATTYFNARIQLTLDGNKAGLILRSCRQEGDSHWLTFEVAQREWKEINLIADFFMELFPTQTHIVRIRHNESKRFSRLTKGKEMVEFGF